MKTLHTAQPTQYPDFWDEEWRLRRAIDELNTRKMIPEAGGSCLTQAVVNRR